MSMRQAGLNMEEEQKEAISLSEAASNPQFSH